MVRERVLAIKPDQSPTRNAGCWTVPSFRRYIASMMPANSAQRRRVLYTGHVQGVGFRFTVRQIAQNFAVNGFVRNLPNGKVELVVEGTPVELDRFLAEIANAMADHIRDVATSSELATGEYGSFVIA